MRQFTAFFILILTGCGAASGLELPDLPGADINIAVATGDYGHADSADTVTHFDGAAGGAAQAPVEPELGSGVEVEPEVDSATHGVLYRAEPTRACSNGDAWITVHGHDLPFDAEPTLVAAVTGESYDLGPDDCGQPRFYWRDSDLIEIRPPQVPSGDYLIGFEAANEVAISLQYCADPVEPTCL